MGLLEYGEYDNLKDVYIRERELIDKHKPKLNGQLPSKININYVRFFQNITCEAATFLRKEQENIIKLLKRNNIIT